MTSTGWPRLGSAAWRQGMRPGHTVEMLLDPHAAWKRLEEDLEQASLCVDIELYMLVADEVGRAFATMLERLPQRGVRVRVILDALGSRSSLGLHQRLEAAGVAVRIYHPLRYALRRIWCRDHRKTVVIDRRVGHVLGRNIGRDYFALEPGGATWADAGVRVEGPVVADIVRAFNQSWAEGRCMSRKRPPAGPALPEPSAALELAPCGGDGVAVAAVALNAGLGRAEVHRRYLRAIREARHRVWVAQPYFLPGLRLQRALCQAALRGVDVRILLPALRHTDVPLVSLATDHMIGRLLERGVRVFLMQNRMIHGKFAVMDCEWWTVGSANLDGLSRTHHLEANLVGAGEDQVRELAGYFEALRGEARELTLATWRRRPSWRKLVARSAYLLRAYL